MNVENKCENCELFKVRKWPSADVVSNQVGESDLGTVLDKITAQAVGDRLCSAKNSVAYGLSECEQPNEFRERI